MWPAMPLATVSWVATRRRAMVFAGIATTMMACQTALMDQEREFLATLGAVTRFELTPDGALILY